MRNLAAEEQRPMPKTTLVEKIPAKVSGGLAGTAKRPWIAAVQSEPLRIWCIYLQPS